MSQPAIDILASGTPVSGTPVSGASVGTAPRTPRGVAVAALAALRDGDGARAGSLTAHDCPTAVVAARAGSAASVPTTAAAGTLQ